MVHVQKTHGSWIITTERFCNGMFAMYLNVFLSQVTATQLQLAEVYQSETLVAFHTKALLNPPSSG